MTSQKPAPAGWVRMVQGLISFFAPPLHSLHWKIFALCLAAVFVPGVYFAWKVGQGIERSHLRSTEEGMIDLAIMLADRWPVEPSESLVHARRNYRDVFGDLKEPNLRVVFMDPAGLVLEDTGGFFPDFYDRSNERDVKKARRGLYGARWERDTLRRAVILYSTVPVVRDDRILGLVTVVKTTEDVRQSVIRSMLDLAGPAALAFVLAAMVSFVLSTYLTRLLKNLAIRAERIAAGEQGVKLNTWSKSEIGDLARALESMRTKLEGREYVQEMALTLSHELKTPISAIHGAAEILENTSDPAVKQKFLGNIFAETARLSSLVGKFLTLSRIETAPAEESARTDLNEVASGVAETFATRVNGHVWNFEKNPLPVWVNAPAEGLRQMMDAILENAFQFTPPGGSISFRVLTDGFEVSDNGPGIPVELRGKVFNRFFTTVNPLTGRRGTGLGLSIVKSLADRYGAEVSFSEGPGTTVRVKFTVFS